MRLYAAVALLCIPVALAADDSRAYEADPTHQTLAELSIQLAITDPRYGEIGRKPYREAITSGAFHEDDWPRFAQHFYDPSTNLGLPENYYTRVFQLDRGTPVPDPFPRYLGALDWGRDGMPDGFHWRGAIEAYDYTATSKGQAYTALGHVLHLLHDMAQPDHARNRPHPCNVVGELAEKHLGLKDYVGYEALWVVRPTWPKATAPRALKSLEEGFTELANESKAAETALQLPAPGDVALGCGTERALVEAVRTGPTGAFIYDWNVVRVIRDHGWDALYDSHWQQTDLNLPIRPTIPRPPGNARTQAYIRLGETLLPRAEAYGAGLLQLFHDIVNAPAFVEEVEIYQVGQRKYRKVWTDEETRDNLPRVRGRRAEVEGGELEPGVEATVFIRIGPKDLDPTVTGFFLRKELAAITVSIVTDGGTPEDTTPLGVTERGEPKWPRGGVWVGSFMPTRRGVIHIEATDRANHYRDALGRRESSLVPVAGRRGTQGELDADPATPARATWRPSNAGGDTPSGTPYPWVGYEAGPDTNHRFTVRGADECVIASLSPQTLESMAWGTWTGTVRSESMTRDFDRLLAGHRAPHARVFTTTRSETTTDVRFRSGVRHESDWLPAERDGAGPRRRMKFGHGEGTVTVAAVEERLYGDDRNPVATQRDTPGGSGVVDSMDGSLAPDGPSAFKYDIGITSRVQLARRESRLIERVAGKMCGDRSLTGHTRRETGKPDSWAYSRRDIRWRFTFAPGAPEHVTRYPASLLLSLGSSVDIAAYEDQVARITDDFFTAHSAAYSRRVSGATTPQAIDEFNRLFTRLMEIRRAYEEAIDGARRFYQDEQEPILSGHSAQARRTYGDLSELWLSNDPDGDLQYSRKLPDVEKAVADWRSTKKSIEDRYVGATEQAASIVQELSPDAAKRLRDLAEKLKKDGLAAGH